MKEIVIASAVRTPIANFGGSLKGFSAAELGALAAGEAIRRAGLTPQQIDEGIFGSARQAGLGPNLARQITWRCGVPEDKTAYTINKACGSGMKAVTLAAQSIQTGENDIVLAGGVEAMSQIPYLLMEARWGYRLGDGTLIDANYRDGYNCPLCDMVMGETVDRMAEEYQISRQMQDAFAAESHRRAVVAQESGVFADEITPISIPQRKKDPIILSADERPRSDSTAEKLAKLKPVFRPQDEGGTITAANASGITDGAAALVLMSAEKANQLGIQPLAVLAGHASAGVAPARMGIAPVPAMRKLLQQTGTRLEDLDLIELNEAFSAQAIMVDQEMGWDPEKRNVHGGAVALGHPTGCTGARIIVSLLHAMRQRDVHNGAATLCISGGLGMSVLVKR